MNQFSIFLFFIPPVFLLAQVFYRIFYSLSLSSLKKFPGPFLWRVSHVPYYCSQLRGNVVRDTARLHRQYGPVVRISPDDLSYTTSPVWSDVWAHRKPGEPEFVKPAVAVPVNGVNGIIAANRENHARYRRLLSHAFSEEGMREQEPNITKYVDKLMDGLARGTGPQDMVKWFKWTTFDLVGDLAFGESFGCLDKEHTHPWVEMVYNSLAVAPFFQAAQHYGLLPMIAWLGPKKLLEGRLRNYQYASDLMDRRVLYDKDRGDFFDHVLKQKPEKGMTHEELKSNAAHLVLAGSETTATLLSGCIFHLLSFPETYTRATHEVRSTFTSPSEMTILAIQRLPYLNAVLTETMRAYPPVPTFSSRVVPPTGATVDSEFLPAGTIVHMMQHVAYNLPSNFSDPDSFHPERWFPEGDRPKQFDNDNRAVHQPFSYGPRNCIGKNLAYFEMRLIMVRLLWSFDLSLPQQGTRERKLFESWKQDQKVRILWDKGPLWVVVKERVGGCR